MISDVIDHGMTVQEAVNAPRIHHQWLPDQITAEPFALSPDTKAALEMMGHKIVEQAPWGAAEAILVGPQADTSVAQKPASNDAVAPSKPIPGLLYGGHDDRRAAGSAAGY